MFPFLSKHPFLAKIISTILPGLKYLKTESIYPEGTLAPVENQLKNNKTSAIPLAGELQAIPLAGELQREIRQDRKFSLAEAIGRESGSFMKGESAVPRPVRAANTIKQFLDSQLAEPSGTFAITLFSWVTADIRVSRLLDTPLVALTQILESLLNEPTTFYEFFRQLAIAHSTITGERPYFQQPGQQPHPKADYTHSSIRAKLSDLLRQLTA